jgi:hypothetical protein
MIQIVPQMRILVRIPMMVIGDSGVIVISVSGVEIIMIGAQRRWRNYSAGNDRQGSTGIWFWLHLWVLSCGYEPAVGAVGMWESGAGCRISKPGGKSGKLAF